MYRAITRSPREFDPPTAGTARCLEKSDPANAAFYQRFGFPLIDRTWLLVPDGPTGIAKRRPGVR